jgi:hypothetical protein
VVVLLINTMTNTLRTTKETTYQDPFAILEVTHRWITDILRSQQSLATGDQSLPLQRSWIDHPYGEEEITLLEEEVLPSILQCLERVREIDNEVRLNG